MNKREQLDLTKITFTTLNEIIPPNSVPYSNNFREMMWDIDTFYEKDDKGRCHLFAAHFQNHVWKYGEIPSYDKMKEYLNVKMDKTYNKHILAINKHSKWIEEIFIKPKWKTRFKKMHLNVKGGK